MTNINNADLKAFYGMAKQKFEESYELFKRTQNGFSNAESHRKRPRLWMITISEFNQAKAVFKTAGDYLHLIWSLNPENPYLPNFPDILEWDEQLNLRKIHLGVLKEGELQSLMFEIEGAILIIGKCLKQLDIAIKELNKEASEIHPL